MTRSDTTRLELAKSTLIRLPGTTRDIRCESGALWITQDGDPRDIVLEAGQQFSPDRRVGSIVYALAPAHLTVRHERAGPSRDHQGRSMPRRTLALE